ncbi:hypothetical protein Q9966_013089 [Columba livia]|nr:hypothetical protein Q9966_013089 [Columba livia]
MLQQNKISVKGYLYPQHTSTSSFVSVSDGDVMMERTYKTSTTPSSHSHDDIKCFLDCERKLEDVTAAVLAMTFNLSSPRQCKFALPYVLYNRHQVADSTTQAMTLNMLNPSPSTEKHQNNGSNSKAGIVIMRLVEEMMHETKGNFQGRFPPGLHDLYHRKLTQWRSMRAEFSGRIFKVRGQSVASTSEEGVSSYKNQMNLRMEIQKCQQGQKRN